MSTPAPKSITGRSRIRKTSRRVQWTDRIARYLIAAGGIGTIVAVVVVFLFLGSVVVPLFLPSSASEPQHIAASELKQKLLRMGCDEHQTLGWTLLDDGSLQTYRIDNGQVLYHKSLINDAKPTAVSFAPDGERVALGFEDGSVRLGRLGYEGGFLSVEKAPEKYRDLKKGESYSVEEDLFTRVSDDNFRRQKLIAEFDVAVPPKKPAPIVKIDHMILPDGGPMFCALTSDGTLTFNRVSKRVNAITDEVTLAVKGGSIALPETKNGLPEFLVVTGQGDAAYVAWSDGRMLRYDARDLAHPAMVEEIRLFTEPDAKLTQLQVLVGRTTLLAGDSLGRVRTWFGMKPEPKSDKVETVMSHDFTGPNTVLPAPSTAGSTSPSTAVTSLAVNPVWRMFAAGYADGSARLFYVTSERLLADVRPSGSGPIQGLFIAPQGNGLAVATAAGITHWGIDLKHPEVTSSALFTKVWYEGFSEPSHDWQSSSGTDDFEKKLGLMPLIFGTLKATFYSLMFGGPLALMAAIYTSEFLHPRTKSRVKPVIEMMASLPSVVLGFLAGIIFAKMLEPLVPRVMTAFVTVPLAFLSGAYLWQLLPRPAALRWARWKFGAILLLLPMGVAAAWQLGPVFERWLFEGDLLDWLSNKEKFGSGFGGIFILLLPLSAFFVVWVTSREVNPWLRAVGSGRSHIQLGLIECFKLLAGIVTTVGLAWMFATILDSFGVDPRGKGNIFDTYVQRNSLILGFMMGFAIIPIIYTVAEDALSSVPQHLRSASLGAGATPWQTAIRIVIPTAMSGLFSAVMIGLGRAVGETMIVLMAAGNTPIMEMNVFNGFQTLSAAIATEMSEAAVGSTHYRMLFLAALTLFVITFVVNSVAEIVRMRFRRRAYEL